MTSAQHIPYGRFIRRRLEGALFGSKDYTPFVVLSRSRTGSTYLLDLIGSNSQVVIRGELFRRRGLVPHSVLFKAIFGKYPSSVSAVGFKIFYYHPNGSDDETIWELLSALPEIRVVHLVRRNVLRSVVSRHIASARKSWAMTKSAVQEQRPIFIEPATILDELRVMSALAAKRLALFDSAQVLELTYEDLVSQTQRAIKDVGGFLGVNLDMGQSELRRQNPGSLHDVLANYAEVKSVLLQSEFADMCGFE